MTDFSSQPVTDANLAPSLTETKHGKRLYTKLPISLPLIEAQVD